MAKKSKYKPRQLKAREVGNRRCETWRAPNGKKLALCVEAKPYGYTGTLTTSTGMTLPVSTGRARSLKSAMSAARQFLRRVKQKGR